MPWLNEVQEKILKKILDRADPQHQLAEALLWRGFPAREESGGIFLLRKSFVGDLAVAHEIKALRKFSELKIILPPGESKLSKAEIDKIVREWLRRTTNGLPLDERLDHAAEVQWSEVGTERRKATLAKILGLPSPVQTAIHAHPTFGRDFPATELDMGVALLVRGIQRRGIFTEVSGHGTDRCLLRVKFDNPSWFGSFRERFNGEFAQRLHEPTLFTWTNEYRQLAVGKATANPAEVFRYFRAAQEFGRLMLSSPDWAHET